MTTSCEFIKRVLRVASRFNLLDEMSVDVDVDTDEYQFYINANDVFVWGAADAVDITPGNIGILEATGSELEAIDPVLSAYTSLLFCCRAERLPPQPRLLEKLLERIKPLFIDAPNYQVEESDAK